MVAPINLISPMKAPGNLTLPQAMSQWGEIAKQRAGTQLTQEQVKEAQMKNQWAPQFYPLDLQKAQLANVHQQQVNQYYGKIQEADILYKQAMASTAPADRAYKFAEAQKALADVSIERNKLGMMQQAMAQFNNMGNAQPITVDENGNPVQQGGQPQSGGNVAGVPMTPPQMERYNQVASGQGLQPAIPGMQQGQAPQAIPQAPSISTLGSLATGASLQSVTPDHDTTQKVNSTSGVLQPTNALSSPIIAVNSHQTQPDQPPQHQYFTEPESLRSDRLKNHYTDIAQGPYGKLTGAQVDDRYLTAQKSNYNAYNKKLSEYSSAADAAMKINTMLEQMKNARENLLLKGNKYLGSLSKTFSDEGQQINNLMNNVVLEKASEYKGQSRITNGLLKVISLSKPDVDLRDKSWKTSINDLMAVNNEIIDKSVLHNQILDTYTNNKYGMAPSPGLADTMVRNYIRDNPKVDEEGNLLQDKPSSPEYLKQYSSLPAMYAAGSGKEFKIPKQLPSGLNENIIKENMSKYGKSRREVIEKYLKLTGQR